MLTCTSSVHKVWKHQLLNHTNFGGGGKPETADIVDRRSEEGRADYVAWLLAWIGLHWHPCGH
jgi:hypothetical protein